MARTKTGLAEIEASYRAGLETLKAELTSEIADIDAKLKALGGRAGKAAKAPVRKPRGRSGKPLRVYVEDALAKAGKAMKVPEVEEAVRKAGYTSAAKDFYRAVFMVLNDDSSNVERVGRGLYARKKASKGLADQGGKGGTI